MKKILLMLVALVATVTISAKDGEEMEGWQKSFTPVANADDLAGIHTAVAGDGSVYASTTYSQTFSFANKPVTDPEGLLSSCVVKYDAEGNEKWSVTFVGKCQIHAMTADADGTLYLAGQTQDIQVVCTDASMKHYEINNPTSDPWGDGPQIDAYSAFIAKIGADGLVQVIKTISPVANAEMQSSGLYYPLEGDIYLRPNKISLYGEKVYVAANYQGDVPEIKWSGSFLNVFDFMYMDNKCAGVFSLNKNDLGTPDNEAYVCNSEPVSYSQYYPEAIDFVVQDNKVYMAFIGFGNLTVENNTTSKAFEFATTDDESGNKEHGLVLVPLAELSKAVKFGAAMHDKDAIPYKLTGATIANSNCIMAGTFYGNFPLDNSITKEVNSSFVASIKMSDCSVNWTTVSPVEAEASCMVVAGEEIKASTNAATYTIKTATGEVDTEQTMAQSFDDADCYNDQYVSTIFTQETSVVVFSPKLKPSGINEAQAQKNGAVKYYNLNGIELTAPQHGLNIVKTADGTRKVLK